VITAGADGGSRSVQGGQCTAGGELSSTVRPERCASPPPAPRQRLRSGCRARGRLSRHVHQLATSDLDRADVTVFTQNAQSADDVASGDSVWLSWSASLLRDRSMIMDQRSTPPAPRLTRSRHDRRDVLKMLASCWSWAAARALAACGGQGAKQAPADQDAVAKYWSDKKQKRPLDFATWALYMPRTNAPLSLHQGDRLTVNYQRGHPGRPVVVRQDPTAACANKPIGTTSWSSPTGWSWTSCSTSAIWPR